MKKIFVKYREDLFFRRQYLFGPRAFCPNAAWNVLKFQDGLFLSAHKDVDSFVISSGGRTIGLVGYLVDPFNKTRRNEEVLKHLHDDSNSVDELLRNVDALTGRWMLIYKDATDCIAFTDPCGMRQVYYAGDGRNVWCGSQPEIIRHVLGLEKNNDPRMKTFLKSKGYEWQESAWVGAKTIYDHCLHLLPNHYLCLKRQTVIRFFPREPLSARDVAAVVDEAASLLSNSIEGMVLRAPLMLAVTAGYDSRVLLAASRNVRDRVEYYIDRLGVHNESHPDVTIPVALTHALGLNFTVLNSAEKVPFWFTHFNRINVTRARNLPKTRMIYARYKCGVRAININGNASEICRNFFDKKLTLKQGELAAWDLSRILYQEVTEYAVDEIENWLLDIGKATAGGYEILDMLYWEQRMGNWGAHFPAEQDIAIEEFSPFNNRRLITLLLSCPGYLRAAPDYELYRQLIRKLWPETLCFPFNPPPESKVSMAWKIRSLLRMGS